MVKQLVFTFTLFLTLGAFAFTMNRLISYFRLTRPGFPVRDIPRRIGIMLNVAFGQTKIFRRPVIGLFHALTFWGFCLILFGSIEMVIDGLSGSERSLSFLGGFYNFLIGSGDVFALLITIAIILFMVRRMFMHIRRFAGIEMKRISHIDAEVALTLILLLMLSLLGMNLSYLEQSRLEQAAIEGAYPVSNLFAGILAGLSADHLHTFHESCWWIHILLIFFFANYLPYSKHFHVFMSVPNVFLSRLDPLGKLPNMEVITQEVKHMLYPEQVPAPASGVTPPARFGVKDAEDATWKNYFDSLACTECGRCTSVCPANLTGKRLSPRKIFMDLRARMKEKGPMMVKNGRDYEDQKSLVRSYITEEELWACTTCNACAQECPININHPTLIVDMRRYLVMEEGAAPGGLKLMFSNIENNGAPWQYSPEDRMLWAENLEMNISEVSEKS